MADRAWLGQPGSRLPLCVSVAGLGGGHIVAAARLQLVTNMLCYLCSRMKPSNASRQPEGEIYPMARGLVRK